jgi:hypothetical protein
MAKLLRTAAELIDEMGGAAQVAEMIGENRTTVGNWRTRGIPAATYLRLQKLIQSKGLKASQACWNWRDCSAG